MEAVSQRDRTEQALREAERLRALAEEEAQKRPGPGEGKD